MAVAFIKSPDVFPFHDVQIISVYSMHFHCPQIKDYLFSRKD